MKRVKIVKGGGVLGWFDCIEDKIAEETAIRRNPGWGRDERWVTAEQEDVTGALETREVEVSPAILAEPGQVLTEAVLDEEGNVITEAVIAVGGEVLIPAVTITEYKLAAEYTITIEDITDELERERTNRESLAYLASTDWYVIRQQETGVAIPQDILEARAAARAAIVR